MNFSLRQLRAFLMVSDLQSFTRASERMHLSQAALSLMIREFEDQVGFKVFERSTRAVVLNTAGKNLYPVVQKSIMDLEDAIRQSANISKYKENLVRVAATSVVCTNILPQFIASLKQKNPYIEIEVRDADRGSIQKMIETGEADIGLGINFQEHPLLQSIHVGHCGLLLVAGKHACDAGPIHQFDPEYLRSQFFYALPAENSMQIAVDDFLTEKSIEISIKQRLSNINTILAMIESNGGCAILPSFVQSACQRYMLQSLILLEKSINLEFMALTRSTQNNYQSAFIVIEEFKKYAKSKYIY